jgi:ankyrin repeat protein
MPLFAPKFSTQELTDRLRQGIPTPLDVTQMQWTPLHRAVVLLRPTTDIEQICCVLTYDQLQSRDLFGYTPLDHAIVRRNRDAANIINKYLECTLWKLIPSITAEQVSTLNREILGDQTREHHIGNFIRMYTNPCLPIYGT